jgi:hypothetical protein
MERGGRRRTRLGGERGAEALALQPGQGGKEPAQISSHDHLMLGGRSGIIWNLLCLALPCFLSLPNHAQMALDVLSADVRRVTYAQAEYRRPRAARRFVPRTPRRGIEW